MLNQLSQAIKEEKPDIVMGFTESTNSLILFYKFLFKKIRVINTVCLFPSLWYKTIKLGSLYKIIIRFYNHADRILVPSNGVKEDLKDNFKIKPELIRVIYNPCDINEIKKKSREKIDLSIFKEKIPVIATMGRLDPMKGQIYLLRALARIKKKIPCRLLILGEGREKKKLEDEARDLEIKDDVLFLGFKKNPFNYLARSDLFVFPSLMEALPNALIEAMACGIPVISFDCPVGPSEILGNNEY